MIKTKILHGKVDILCIGGRAAMPTGYGSKYGAFVYRFMAKSLKTVPIETIEAEQKEKADKRQDKLKKRLAELNAKKAELEKPKTKKKK